MKSLIGCRHLQQSSRTAEPGDRRTPRRRMSRERAEAFRALIQGPYKKDYDRQVQMIVRERLKKLREK